MELLLVFSLVVAVTCLPSGNGDFPGEIYGRLTSEDYATLASLPRRRIGTNLPGFHYIFVGANGQISRTRGPRGTQVEIAGSPLTSDLGLRVAADVLAKMTLNMPSTIFQKLASNAGAGVFTAAEKLSVFPEFANLANGNCGTSCSGTCARTCTFDGRKWDDIAGVGAQRGVVLEDNLLCTARDPYHSKDNILSHEFTHTIHANSLPDSVVQQITNAYNNAHTRATWSLNSYAMSNDHEYFAEAGSAFFGISFQLGTPGGMNLCSTNTICSSELTFRGHIQATDPNLYNVMSYVFTNNRPYLTSGLTVCPPNSVIVG